MKNLFAEKKINIKEHLTMHLKYYINFFAKNMFKIFACIAILFVFSLDIAYADDETPAPVQDTNDEEDNQDSIEESSQDSEGGTSPIQDIKNTAAEVGSTLDTIIDTLSTLTCETEGIGNLLRTEFVHTCVLGDFLTFMVANIVSPGIYANTFLRLAINDEELFPGTCLRENRVDPNDLKMSFGMCSNTKLAVARVAAISEVGVTIAKTLFTGENVWDAILGAWNLPKDQYYEMFLDQKVGDEGLMVDIGIIPVFPWKVVREKDKLCVSTQSLFLSWIPVGCKYIKEPYPTSIYADFLDVGTTIEHSELKDITSLTSCSNMGSCYQKAYQNSQAPIVVTGPIISCVREMVAKMMISTNVCSFDDVKSVLGSESRQTSAFFQFQKNMHRIVSALLTIYVILFGFKVVLGGDIPPKADLINFLIKFIFVVYFSVGININADSDDDTERLDGMIEWVIPFLMNGMDELSSWIIGADPNNFCNFQDVDYPREVSYLKLWDALDCRMMSFLGIDTLMMVAGGINSDKEGKTETEEPATPPSNNNAGNKDDLTYNIPAFIIFLFPALLSGSIILVILCFTYPIFIISFVALMVNATVVCIISIVILAVLAPLFVPMYLFDYTKGYFEAWLKLLISFMLQPMIIVTFMTLMMALNDRSFNGTCEFQYIDVQMGEPSENSNIYLGGVNFSTGFLNDGRSFRYFYPNFNWEEYDSEEEIEGCKNSLLYFANQIKKFDIEGAFANNSTDTKVDDKDSFIVKKPGMFFSTVEIVFEKLRMFAISLFAMYLITYLMTKFADTITDFAADVSESVSLGSVTVKPATIQAALKKAVSFAANIAGTAINKGGKNQATDALKKSGKKVTGKLSAVREGAIKGVIKAGGAAVNIKNKVQGDSSSSKKGK